MVRKKEDKNTTNRREFLTKTGAAGTALLAGCIGNGDDTDDDEQPETIDENGNGNETQPGNGEDERENGDDTNGNGEEEFEPEYVNDDQEITLADYEPELSDEPIDIFDGELTQEELTTEYLLDDVTGVRETEDQEQYQTDLKIVTELLETDHTTENQETQVRETTENTTQNQYTEQELQNQIREETTINLPEELRNYTLKTTITDHQNNTTTEETTTLNFADAYTQARYIHRFENAPALGPDAELREIEIEDDKIAIEYEVSGEIGAGDFNSTIAEIAGNYVGVIETAQVPYEIGLTVEDNEGKVYTASSDDKKLEEFIDGELSSHDILVHTIDELNAYRDFD